MQAQTPSPETWAIAELMGHKVMAGRISPCSIFPTMIRIDVPETTTSPPFSVSVNPASFYKMNWCDEETARAHAEVLKEKPLELYSVRKVIQYQMLAESKISHPIEYGDSESEFNTPDQDYEEEDSNYDCDDHPADQAQW